MKRSRDESSSVQPLIWHLTLLQDVFSPIIICSNSALLIIGRKGLRLGTWAAVHTSVWVQLPGSCAYFHWMMYFTPEMLADFHRNVTLWLPMEEANGAVGRSVFSGEKTRFHSPCPLSVKAGESVPASSSALSTLLPQLFTWTITDAHIQVIYFFKSVSLSGSFFLP